MSKLIESLRVGAKDPKKYEEAAPASQEKQKNNYELTQEQLAEIYFASSSKNKSKEATLPESPLVIKVIEKERPAAVGPWVVAILALVIAIFGLFSTKRIFFDIKIVDDLNSKRPAVTEHLEFDSQEVSSAKNSLRYGDPLPLQNFIFEGAAKLSSSKSKKSLVLVNSSVSPFARAHLYFDPPMDLSRSKIVFYAKSSRSGSDLAFALKDNNNLLAFEKGKIKPFPAQLSTGWQIAEIPVYKITGDFDSNSVTSIRFEFGSKDAENKPGDIISIKNLEIVPA